MQALAGDSRSIRPGSVGNGSIPGVDTGIGNSSPVDIIMYVSALVGF